MSRTFSTPGRIIFELPTWTDESVGLSQPNVFQRAFNAGPSSNGDPRSNGNAHIRHVFETLTDDPNNDAQSNDINTAAQQQHQGQSQQHFYKNTAPHAMGPIEQQFQFMNQNNPFSKKRKLPTNTNESDPNSVSSPSTSSFPSDNPFSFLKPRPPPSSASSQHSSDSPPNGATESGSAHSPYPAVPTMQNNPPLPTPRAQPRHPQQNSGVPAAWVDRGDSMHMSNDDLKQTLGVNSRMGWLGNYSLMTSLGTSSVSPQSGSSAAAPASRTYSFSKHPNEVLASAKRAQMSTSSSNQHRLYPPPIRQKESNAFLKLSLANPKTKAQSQQQQSHANKTNLQPSQRQQQLPARPPVTSAITKATLASQADQIHEDDFLPDINIDNELKSANDREEDDLDVDPEEGAQLEEEWILQQTGLKKRKQQKGKGGAGGGSKRGRSAASAIEGDDVDMDEEEAEAAAEEEAKDEEPPDVAVRSRYERLLRDGTEPRFCFLCEYGEGAEKRMGKSKTHINNIPFVVIDEKYQTCVNIINKWQFHRATQVAAARAQHYYQTEIQPLLKEHRTLVYGRPHPHPNCPQEVFYDHMKLHKLNNTKRMKLTVESCDQIMNSLSDEGMWQKDKFNPENPYPVLNHTNVKLFLQVSSHRLKLTSLLEREGR